MSNLRMGDINYIFEEIYLDKTEYSIWVKNVTNVDTDKIKLVSKIAKVNYNVAKQILASESTCILKAKALEMRDAIKQLESVGIPFEVTPRFEY